MIQRVVFILGAGASRAISSDILVMCDFFQKCAPFLDQPEKSPAIWLALGILEEARCFSVSNSKAENAAAYMMNTHWAVLEAERGLQKLPEPQLAVMKKAFLESVNYYRDVFLSDGSRLSANLETVFSNAEFFMLHSPGNSRRNDPYRRLIFAVGYLLGLLQKAHPAPRPHQELARLFKSWHLPAQRTAHFISFNYDVWLERSLQEAGMWHPRTGYQFEFQRFTNVANAQSSFEQWRQVFRTGSGDVSKEFRTSKFTQDRNTSTWVLKPHGSLSWYRYERPSDGTHNPDEYIVLMESDQDSLISTGTEMDWKISDHVDESGKEDLVYEPVIAPPTRLKRRHLPVFWEVDHRMGKVIEEADAIVIIGWSMPETDAEHRQKLLHALEHRNKQLQRLIIIDLDINRSKDEFYLKFESLFRPAEGVFSYPEGFTEESIRKVFSAGPGSIN